MSLPAHRKLTLAIASVATFAIGGLATATSADAAPNSCPGKKWLCVWQDYGYGGDFAKVKDTTGLWSTLKGGEHCQKANFNDCVSSFWNETGKTVTLFRDAHCSGDSLVIESGEHGNLPHEWNDIVSSNMVAGSSTTC
jgi:hypothetical protein